MKPNIQRAFKALEAAVKSAKSFQGRSQLESVQIFTNGYAEPGYQNDGEVIATGNWNVVSKWHEATHKFTDVDDTPKRLADVFEQMGVSIEWSDEWTDCGECGKLIRTSGDSYSWTPSYKLVDDCTILCLECLEEDPEEHLRSLEGNPNTANTIDTIDPGDHGYFLARDGFENGWHSGQDDDPKLIAEALEKMGIERYLFNYDEQSQFYIRFSVYVHEDEKEKFKEEEFNPKKGPSNSAALDRGLQEAARQMDQIKEPGIKIATVVGDTATVKVVSQRGVHQRSQAMNIGDEYSLKELPKYVMRTEENQDDKSVLKWSGKKEPPEIGEEVFIGMNDLGRGVVKGYFAEAGWLGVYVKLSSPPDWWKKQNKDNLKREAMIFGAELRPDMGNKAMQRKLDKKECLDLNKIATKVEDGSALDILRGTWLFKEGAFVDDVDYCDAKTEDWVWSIGRNMKDGKIYAAFDSRFYSAGSSTVWECIWLR